MINCLVCKMSQRIVIKKNSHHADPVCRNRSQGDGSGPENSGAGGPRRRCLHHGPQSCCRYAGLGSWRYGRLSTSHSWGQGGTDFPRRCRESAEAGAGETFRTARGVRRLLVLQAARLSSSFCQTAAPVPQKLTTSNVLQQNSAGCQNRNILTTCESMRILLL